MLLVAVLTAALAAGCRSHRASDDAKSGPEVIYQRSQKMMRTGDYGNAIKQLEALQTRFPFSEAARQAQLDLIYAYYKDHQTDPAVDAAETFIREKDVYKRQDRWPYRAAGGRKCTGATASQPPRWPDR